MESDEEQKQEQSAWVNKKQTGKSHTLANTNSKGFWRSDGDDEEKEHTEEEGSGCVGFLLSNVNIWKKQVYSEEGKYL